MARLYNPTAEEKAFTLTLGGVTASGVAKGGEVVSAVFDKDKAEVLHDSMPV